MNWESSLIGLILFLFVITIMILIGANGRKKEKQLLQSLKKFAAESYSKIDQYDIWNNSAIGINKIDGIIFTVTDINNNKSCLKAELREIRSCRITNVAKNHSSAQGAFREVELLELVLVNKNKNLPDTVLNFYNAGIDGHSLAGEHQLIDKWNRIIADICAVPVT